MNINYTNIEGEQKHIVLLEKIGSGKFGIVYESLLDGFGKIAVKVLKFEYKTAREAKTEVKIAGLITDTYAMTVKKVIANPISTGILKDISPVYLSYSTDIPVDKIYFVYELADGFPLDKIIQLNMDLKTYFTKPIFYRYVKDLIYGMAEMHSKNITHKDIKPANIMLCRGTLKYIDFGISCFPMACVDGGTPNYSPPEYFTKSPAMSSPSDWFSKDVFALGVTLLIMITNNKKLIWSSLDTFDNIKHQCSTQGFAQEFLNKTVLENLNGLGYDEFIVAILGMTSASIKDRWTTEQCVEFANSL